MRRIVALLIGLVGSAASLRAETVTLPAAASIVGGAPFFSDVRAFNTSYSGSLAVTATYRCFIATVACPSSAPQVSFTLAPRESRAFDDMVAQDFAAPDTAGGVEFEFSGSSDQLVVTSRLFSTVPTPTVGMFIPGLRNSEAHTTSVLTSIRNLGLGAGFRTNVGVFNREDSGVTVTFTIFDGGAQAGLPVIRSVAAHSGVQVTGIFTAAGVPNLSTDDAVIVVSATGEIFSYAAVIDNATTDPIFVVGAEDQSQQPIATSTPTPPGGPTATRTPTRTPTSPGGPTATRTATRTPTAPGGPTATRTPTATQPPGPTATNTPTLPGPTSTLTATATRTPTRTPTPTATPLPNQVNVGPGMAFSPSTITINAGETVNWVWRGSGHSTTSDTGVWDSGVHSINFVFSRTFPTGGLSFPYHCVIHGAPGGVGMSGTVNVN